VLKETQIIEDARKLERPWGDKGVEIEVRLTRQV
jgi:hypothetical protein